MCVHVLVWTLVGAFTHVCVRVCVFVCLCVCAYSQGSNGMVSVGLVCVHACVRVCRRPAAVQGVEEGEE